MPVVKKNPKPRTHKFLKEIVSEGTYRTYDKKTGSYSIKHLSREDLDKMVNTFNRMKEMGLRIPAPWKHDFEVNTFSKVESGESGVLEDSTRNAGFWDSLTVSTNEKGKAALKGYVEVPGDPDNPDTPAGKVGTSVKDTSIYLRGKYEVPDSNETIENALMHIALVTHPIERDQKNFELLPEDGDYAIAMSEMMDSGAEIQKLIDLLASVAKIYLAPNTTEDTLASNLLISLSQLELIKSKDKDSNKNDPLNTSFEMEPLVMANMSQDEAQAIVTAKVINPRTQKPFTLAELTQAQAEPVNDPKVKQLEIMMSHMQSTLQDDRRRSFRDRINSLVESGRCPKTYADTNLYPKADQYTLAIQNDGTVVSPPLEEIIMSLEAMPEPASVKASAPDSITEEDFHADSSSGLPEAEAEELAVLMSKML